MKKFFVLMLVLALLCGTLAACQNPQALIEKADAALEKAPYAVTMKMNFECDDKDLNAIFSAMNMEIPMTVDGKNISMKMGMDVSGYSAKVNVTVADMVMYYDMSVLGQSVKMKSTMNEEQYKEFMNENSADMMLKAENFGELTMESKDGKKHISCAKPNEEALKKLNEMLEDSLKAQGAKATVSDVSYNAVLKDGKYESMDMDCVYAVTIAGKTYNVTFKLSAEFSYENVEKISAPADADKYQETNFDELIG